VVGLFLNTLPLRIDTSGDPSFRELVARVRTAATEVHRHQVAPFERIVETVQPARALGRNPIFQTVLTVREGGGAPWELPGLDVEPLNYEGGWTKFDLSVIASPSPRSMSMLWQYATALFDAATIDRLARQFEQVLRAGIAHSDVPLSALPLASDQDLRSLGAWNDTAAPVSEGCVHERIAAQAAATPHAPAVRDESGCITYQELEVRANQLAHHLIGLGVRPDARVAICLERGIDLEVAVLGVLKAGGAYVPLDPEYPRDRLAFMVEDSGAVALMTTSQLRDVLPSHLSTVLMDEAGAFDQEPTTAPATTVGPCDLAYIIYTSGTTGRPKGVAVEHRSVVNSLDWMQRTFRLGPGDTVLQKAPLSFDASCWEVLWTPMTGARLFMPRPGGHRDPRYLAAVIQREDVTFINLVPSMLNAFLATPEARACRSLRTVISAGEALPEDVKERFFATLPWAELHNYYGPTETTISVTGDHCAPGVPVALGRPAANTRLLIIDAAGNEQPVGVPGELLVAGVQVSRGYLGRPEMTAERFVLREGERVYRTGDLAAWQPDGRIRYLGRRDDQVKIRGNRIELGEVAAILRTVPDVIDAGALARDGELIGFVVPADRARWDPAALRRSMRSVAPAHLVPTTLHAVETLPRLPNGKLDQKALVTLAASPVAERETDPPCGPAEELVAELWGSLLGVPFVGAEDDFFDLGGNSLTAARFVAQLQAMDVDLPLMTVFTHPTVRALAEPVARLLLDGLDAESSG
jgi:amino acid adenylation domain-containing protein